MNIVWPTLRFNISSGVDEQKGVLGEQRCGSINFTVLSSKSSTLSTYKPYPQINLKDLAINGLNPFGSTVSSEGSSNDQVVDQKMI